MGKILLLSVLAFLLAAVPAYAVETEVPLNEGDRQPGQDKVWNFSDVGLDDEAVLEMADKIAKSGSGGGQGRGRGRSRGSDDGIFDDSRGRGRGSDDGIFDDSRGRGRGSDDGIFDDSRGRGSDDGIFDSPRGRGRGSDDPL
jgi:hypothetical protein